MITQRQNKERKTVSLLLAALNKLIIINITEELQEE